MRITGITSRIISYDVSAIYGEVGPPQEISTDYRYSFDTIHTDEGIDGPLYHEGLVGAPLAIDADGLRHLPDAPGLGVEMDMDWVDDHTIEVIETRA